MTQRSRLPTVVHYNFAEFSDLNNSLNTFWELEGVPACDLSSPDETLAEKQFTDLHYRSFHGVYFSPILCKLNIEETLGDSYEIAMSHLLSLEHRLRRSSELQMHYNNFLDSFS